MTGALLTAAVVVLVLLGLLALAVCLRAGVVDAVELPDPESDEMGAPW